MENNIEEFNHIVGLVLAELYKHFPKPIDLKISELMPSANGIKLDPEKKITYVYTVRFLSEENYLRYSNATMSNDMFLDVVLTSKGLAALNKVPEAINGVKKTVGDNLIEFSKDAMKASAKEIVKNLVKLVFDQ